ncbi:hypothetical protein K9N68_34105 (plasmid) [Kovacikia minuta CCNUW1]|uniref:hypothetical protein n=1 Tax=Kovacikia minuta TaxID=2931930 RepID=UPI001CCB2051|nr:hypothetical protein [Kovacikia minuta]UBF30253.1 hypothetical protein K9N68_34105 [Kovacikia minuta CCNUW1]
MMNTTELHEQIDKHLEQLSCEQLQIVLSFLTHLVQPSVEKLSQRSNLLLLQPETILPECPPDEFKVDRCDITPEQLQKLVLLVWRDNYLDRVTITLPIPELQSKRSLFHL